MSGPSGHKFHNFSPVARQPEFTWQAFTQIDVPGLKCYHPSMTRIGSPGTEL